MSLRGVEGNLALLPALERALVREGLDEHGLVYGDSVLPLRRTGAETE
jgi:hypothetical protein